ncbi:MAG: hypothetical protein HPY85_06835 [Anaerolineae bacterium]|nr:hypothetical protein [Anaerolineae bacterium]
MGSLIEVNKFVEALCPQVSAALTGDYISLKGAHRAWVVVHIQQANAATIEIGVNEATSVAGGSAAAIAKDMKIWANEDLAAGDTLTRQTDADTFTTSAALKHKMVVIEIDPGLLSDGFDCIAVTLGASNAANIVQAMYVIEPRYAGSPANMPSAIVD